MFNQRLIFQQLIQSNNAILQIYSLPYQKPLNLIDSNCFFKYFLFYAKKVQQKNKNIVNNPGAIGGNNRIYKLLSQFLQKLKKDGRGQKKKLLLYPKMINEQQRDIYQFNSWDIPEAIYFYHEYIMKYADVILYGKYVINICKYISSQLFIKDSKLLKKIYFIQNNLEKVTQQYVNITDNPFQYKSINPPLILNQNTLKNLKEFYERLKNNQNQIEYKQSIIERENNNQNNAILNPKQLYLYVSNKYRDSFNKLKANLIQQHQIITNIDKFKKTLFVMIQKGQIDEFKQKYNSQIINSEICFINENYLQQSIKEKKLIELNNYIDDLE